MNLPNFAKQFCQFRKSIFDMSFNAVTTLQDYTEQMAESYMAEEMQKPVKDYLGLCRDACGVFKKTVETGFEVEEQFYNVFEKTEK